MLPKDKFITTLSKSITNRTDSLLLSETPIQYVKGVGPGLGSVFKSRDIHTVQDLIYFFPRTYEDRSQFQTVSSLVEGSQATLTVRVLSLKKIPIPKLGRTLLEVRCTDETGVIGLKWFNSPRGMEHKFIPGIRFTVTGKVKLYKGAPEIVHPEITWGMTAAPDADLVSTEGHPNVGRVVPVYIEIEGVQTRTLRKVLWEALQKYRDSIEEDIPQYLAEKRKLPSLAQAISDLHFPPEEMASHLALLSECKTPAHHRLIYGEFFKFEYFMLRKKLKFERTHPPILQFESSSGLSTLWREFEKLLPFQLTQGQIQALEEIHQDFSGAVPMNRLIQGDVGSGKTAVAFLSAATILAGGGQAALMAPTEILAEQHLKNALKLFGTRLTVALLTGKTSASERSALQQRLDSGEPILVIGTHALIEDSIHWRYLAYIMIDEQHRFGVEQRKALRLKGAKKNPVTGQVTVPHSLILTATPIPRTLALTAFGDLAVTSIRELPPGRSPILTRVGASEAQRNRALAHIKQELKNGRQAYFIYPLVNDSEAEGFTQLKSAVAETQLLAQEVFPDFKVGLLHGQMKPEEKTDVMEKFKQGEVQILVSTTVVEVGVDVPNATLIVIEHAERFGLSQLHQLRGRVGRGQFQSYCYLFSTSKAPGGINPRLEVLAETTDGFKIAEADLEIRGPGEFLGTRQAGSLPFKIASLIRDQDWLIFARDDAMAILASDPELKKPEHHCLKKYTDHAGLALS